MRPKWREWISWSFWHDYIFAPYNCWWWIEKREWHGRKPGPQPWKFPGWRTVLCRLKGHPKGPVFFNPGGLEPNPDCWDCGEEIA